MFVKIVFFITMLCYFILSIILVNYTEAHSSCSNGINGNCSSVRPIRYLLYDVNPPEGFNLRRDVYIRMAVLTNKLQKQGNWVLVLPPWPNLYHWRSQIHQERLPWSMFFDVHSLQKFVPVIELMDFLDMQPSGIIDDVYILQHFSEMFKTGNFVDKLEIRPCQDQNPYAKQASDGRYHGNFWGFLEITAKNVNCLSFHGQASLIMPFFKNISSSSVMLDHAEVVLHDRYGDSTYWRARRSMRFAKSLINYASRFRAKFLNSTDEADGTVLPADWTFEKASRKAKGGPYLCVHLRRRDFVRTRSKDVPSLSGAIRQIKRILREIDLKTVFVATDAPINEKEELQEALEKIKVSMVTYRPTPDELNTFKDGGVAIIEQIICSHGRKFYGSHESTFSFRIQEEREILGFPPDTTFNRLCGDDQKTCEQPSRWLIRH